MRTHQPATRTAATSRVETKGAERGAAHLRAVPPNRLLAAAAPARGPVHQYASLALNRSSDSALPPNRTGLPDRLRAGIEHLSGFAMDDVRVHYNSAKPASVQALAYTKGTEIHVGPGQEKHLPHEAWHVVQQKQGRVKPTLQMKGVAINDDAALEREAEVMGGRVVANTSLPERVARAGSLTGLIQRMPFVYDPQKNKEIDIGSMNLAELKKLAKRLPYQLRDPVEERIEQLKRRERRSAEEKAPPTTAAAAGKMIQHGTKAVEYDIKADTKETQGLITTAAGYTSSATKAGKSAAESIVGAAASAATGGIAGKFLAGWGALKSGLLAKRLLDLAAKAETAAKNAHTQQEKESIAPADLVKALRALGDGKKQEALAKIAGAIVPGAETIADWLREEKLESAIQILEAHQGNNEFADAALYILEGWDITTAVKAAATGYQPIKEKQTNEGYASFS